MQTSQLVLSTTDGPTPAYEAQPDGDARGGIVVLQEAFGVTRHIEENTERVAASGWQAVAPALFHGEGSPTFEYDDLASVMPAMEGLSAAGIGADLDAAGAHLSDAGWPDRRQGIVGFCLGDTVAFHAAIDAAFGAAVTFYGGGIGAGRLGYPAQLARAGQLRAPWLGLYGDLDKGMPVEEVEARRASAAGAPVPTDVVRYADADHGFNCNDRPGVHNPAAASDAWARMLARFDAYLAGS